MRKGLLTLSMLAALSAASPVSAQWAAFNEWDFCSGNALSVCMNFDLMRDGATNNYRLRITYVSTEAAAGEEGAMTSAGLYRNGSRTAVDLNVSNIAIVETTPSGVIWSIGSNQLNGEGKITIEVAGNSDNGINNGLPVGGSILLSFSSTNLSTYNLDGLYARSHIQGFGPNGCSLKPDSQGPDFVVDGVGEIDERCGAEAEVVPEPITMILMGTGLLGVGAARRRRKRDNQIIADA